MSPSPKQPTGVFWCRSDSGEERRKPSQSMPRSRRWSCSSQARKRSIGLTPCSIPTTIAVSPLFSTPKGTEAPVGWHSAAPPFGNIRRRYGLRSFSDHLHAKKLFTVNEIARKLDVSPGKAFVWAKQGVLDAKLHPAKKLYLCTLQPATLRQRLRSEREEGRMTRRLFDKVMNRLNEVQYEL